jgi:hypothetical protein
LNRALLAFLLISSSVPTSLWATETADLLGKWGGEWAFHRSPRRGFSVEIISIETDKKPASVRAIYCWEKPKKPTPKDKAGCLPAEGTLDIGKMFLVLHYTVSPPGRAVEYQVRMDFRKNYAVRWGPLGSASGDLKRAAPTRAEAQ